MIHPLIRINRMTSAAFIFPENPLAAAIAAEVVTTVTPTIAPLFSNLFWRKILFGMTIFMFTPTLFHAYCNNIKNIKADDTLYVQSEICLTLLFLTWNFCYIMCFL